MLKISIFGSLSCILIHIIVNEIFALNSLGFLTNKIKLNGYIVSLQCVG